MPIDDEMFVRRLLVLADARFEQRGALQPGEPIGEVIARRLQRFGTRDSGLGSRVDDKSSGIVGDFEAAPLVAGNAVHEPRTMVRPDGQRLLGEAPIARRRPEEEDFLPGWFHPLTNHIGEERAKPRPAGKDKVVSRQFTVVRQAYRGKLSSTWLDRRLHGELPVLAPLGDKRLEHRGARPPGSEVAADFLQDRPADLLAIYLREAARHLGALQLLECHARVAEDRQGRFLVRIVAFDEPQHADAVEELPVPTGLVLLPERP